MELQKNRQEEKLPFLLRVLLSIDAFRVKTKRFYYRYILRCPDAYHGYRHKGKTCQCRRVQYEGFDYKSQF